MCAARGAAESGQRLCALLSALHAEAARQARLSAAQEQEAGTGQLSPHRLHRRLSCCHPAAPAGPATAERTRLSTHHRPQPPLGPPPGAAAAPRSKHSAPAKPRHPPPYPPPPPPTTAPPHTPH